MTYEAKTLIILQVTELSPMSKSYKHMKNNDSHNLATEKVRSVVAFDKSDV